MGIDRPASTPKQPRSLSASKILICLVAMFYKSRQTLLRQCKDYALTYLLRPLADSLLQKYAAVLNVRLDSATQCLTLEVLLKGEHEPLTIRVERYELHTRDGTHYLSLYGVTTSREWLNALLETLSPNLQFKLPANVPLKLLQCFI